MSQKPDKRIEKWSETIFPGSDDEAVKRYFHLHDRELVIVACAILDTALAELISLRLVGNEDEIDKLLGLSNDADAPIGSFSARIRSAHLLGIITPLEAKTLSLLRGLRNGMAHRVNIDLHHPCSLKYITQIIECSLRSGSEQPTTAKTNEMKELVSKTSWFSENAIRGLLIMYQYNFDRRKASIKRLAEASDEQAGEFINK